MTTLNEAIQDLQEAVDKLKEAIILNILKHPWFYIIWIIIGVLIQFIPVEGE